jgi:hypothetical protein
LAAASAAIARLCKYQWNEWTYLLCVMGYTLLVISDAILLQDEIRRGKGKRSHAVVIMVTYITGEFCLHYGIAIDPRRQNQKSLHTD